MRTTLMLAAAMCALAGPLSARQKTIVPPQSVHAACMRTDVAKSKALLQAAMAKTPPEEVEEVQKQIAGCVYYRVSLHSSVTVLDNEVAGVSSRISGGGSITFGLAPDVSEPDYALTSGTRDLSAPIYWVQDSVLITKPGCVVATAVVPYTPFGFWLGVTSQPAPKVAVRIVPDDHDLHTTKTRCKDPLGRWTPDIPGKEAIFAPAWIKLHGEGEIGQPAGALDMANIAAMDPAKLAAMAEKMKAGNPADMAEMRNMMNQIVPNADARLAAARDNFMFKAPGKWCVADRVGGVVCTVSDTVKLQERTGYGTLKTVIEHTVITIAKVPPPAGS